MDIKKYIDQNFGNIVNVEEIVNHVHFSSSYSNHVFKRITGNSIFDYLVSVRIEKAKNLLTNSKLKIYEISELVGYSTKSYFGSIFKKYTGMTPKHYRDNYTTVDKVL